MIYANLFLQYVHLCLMFLHVTITFQPFHVLSKFKCKNLQAKTFVTCLPRQNNEFLVDINAIIQLDRFDDIQHGFEITRGVI